MRSRSSFVLVLWSALWLGMYMRPSIAEAQTPGSETSPPGREILDRLDRLERQNAELLKQISGLRELIASAHGVEAAKQSPEQPSADRQDVSEHRIEELAQTRVEASQRFPVQLTGMALFNAFKNGPYGGGAQNPVVAALTVSPSDTGAGLRQSILGLTFQGPQTLWGGKTSGSLLMDFFGGTQTSTNHILRLRVATFQIDWKDTTFAVGQDKPIVSRREPNSLAQVGVSPLTGAGNPWLWQPQARVEQRFSLSPNTSVRAEAGVFQTSEAANQEYEVASVIQSGRPALQARVSVSHKFSDDGVVEIAPVFHTSTSHFAGMSLPSRLFGVDWLIKPSSKFEITGLVFSGRNFSNLGALGEISLVSPNLPIAIRGDGGWAQLRFLASSKLSFDLYGGQQDDRNRDLEAGEIAKNQYYAGNVQYMLGSNVLASFEVGHVITTYLGTGNRSNNHYDLALAYLF